MFDFWFSETLLSSPKSPCTPTPVTHKNGRRLRSTHVILVLTRIWCNFPARSFTTHRAHFASNNIFFEVQSATIDSTKCVTKTFFWRVPLQKRNSASTSRAGRPFWPLVSHLMHMITSVDRSFHSSCILLLNSPGALMQPQTSQGITSRSIFVPNKC